MADKMPFDEDTMTMILGLGGPEEPGQHGLTEMAMPEQSAVDLIIQIKDLCLEFLEASGKSGEQSAPRPEKGSKEKPLEEEEK